MFLSVSQINTLIYKKIKDRFYFVIDRIISHTRHISCKHQNRRLTFKIPMIQVLALLCQQR